MYTLARVTRQPLPARLSATKHSDRKTRLPHRCSVKVNPAQVASANEPNRAQLPRVPLGPDFHGVPCGLLTEMTTTDHGASRLSQSVKVVLAEVECGTLLIHSGRERWRILSLRQPKQALLHLP
jgi:hypothetical protein